MPPGLVTRSIVIAPAPGAQSSSRSASTDLCICRAYEVRLGKQNAGRRVPLDKHRARRIVDFRRCHRPDPIGPRFDLLQALANGERRPDDIRRARQAVPGVDRSRLHAFLCAPELVRVHPVPHEPAELAIDRRFQVGNRDPRLWGRIEAEDRQIDRARRIMGAGRQCQTAVEHQHLVEPRAGAAAENFGKNLQRVGLRRLAGAITRSEIGAVPLRLRRARALHLEPRRCVMRRFLDPHTRRQALSRDRSEIAFG